MNRNLIAALIVCSCASCGGDDEPCRVPGGAYRAVPKLVTHTCPKPPSFPEWDTGVPDEGLECGSLAISPENIQGTNCTWTVHVTAKGTAEGPTAGKMTASIACPGSDTCQATFEVSFMKKVP